MEAYEGYWRKVPAVKRLVYRSVPEATTRLAMLKRGEVDLAYLLDTPMALEIKRDPTLKLAFSGGIGTYFLDFLDMSRLSETVPHEGAFAYGSFPDIDELYRLQALESDSKQREALLHQIQRLLYERVRFAPIFDNVWPSGVGPRVAEPALCDQPLSVVGAAGGGALEGELRHPPWIA
jgi:ABC-type transport system substrate-binding protein